VPHAKIPPSSSHLGSLPCPPWSTVLRCRCSSSAAASFTYTEKFPSRSDGRCTIDPRFFLPFLSSPSSISLLLLQGWPYSGPVGPKKFLELPGLPARPKLLWLCDSWVRGNVIIYRAQKTIQGDECRPRRRSWLGSPRTRSYPELLRFMGPLLSLVLRTEDVCQRYNQYTEVCGALNQGFSFSPLQCWQGRTRMDEGVQVYAACWDGVVYCFCNYVTGHGWWFEHQYKMFVLKSVSTLFNKTYKEFQGTMSARN